MPAESSPLGSPARIPSPTNGPDVHQGPALRPTSPVRLGAVRELAARFSSPEALDRIRAGQVEPRMLQLDDHGVRSIMREAQALAIGAHVPEPTPATDELRRRLDAARDHHALIGHVLGLPRVRQAEALEFIASEAARQRSIIAVIEQAHHGLPPAAVGATLRNVQARFPDDRRR